MLKVVISDDEPKICRLIENLINWQEYNMKLMAVTHNGIDTLKAIEEMQPDLVITDIRMPGHDGLDLIKISRERGWDTKFIIISGYSHFEYAQSAIKFGVIDYILKPIKKTDLSFALNRIKNNLLPQDDYSYVENSAGIKERATYHKQRGLFLYNLIYHSEMELSQITLEELNSKYDFKFSLGLFRIIGIKFDGLGEGNSSALEFSSKKAKQIVQEHISSYVHDMEYYFKESTLYILINYSMKNWREIRKGMKKLLDKLQLNESIFSGFKVTIGIGKEADSPSKLFEAYKSALWAYEERLVVGTVRLIHWEDIVPSTFRESVSYKDFLKQLEKALELLSIDEISMIIRNLKDSLLAKRYISGYEVYSIAREITYLYLEQLRKSQVLRDNDKEQYQRLIRRIQEIQKISEIFDFLIDDLTEFFQKEIKDRGNEEIEPIKRVKKYIAENYMNHLTLEEVSRLAGFNPSYFSTVFKKAIGTTFLDYLSEVRINNAKELLRDSNYSIRTVCEEVGYSDLKHFSKCFVKYTGLKPNEFRKLYS